MIRNLYCNNQTFTQYIHLQHKVNMYTPGDGNPVNYDNI